MASTERLRRPVPQRRPLPARAAPSLPKNDPGTGLCGVMPVGGIMHGTQGVGKTAFMAQFEDVGFIINRKERGIYDLTRSRQVPEPVFIKEMGGADLKRDPGFRTLIGELYGLCGDNEGCKTVVIDSLTPIQTMGFHEHCKENFDGDFTKEGYFAYGQGPKSFAVTMFTEFLDACESIKDAGMNIFLLAHTDIKPYKNPTGPNYDRFIPKLDVEVWSQAHAWAQLILFYNFEVQINEVRGSKGERGKVRTNTQTRMIYTQRTEAFDAKERWGLSPVIHAGNTGKEAYDNFISDFQRCFPE